MPTPREEIEEVLVDCYSEYEQMPAWKVAFSDEVQVPFDAVLLGTPVEVTGFRLSKTDTLQCRAIHDRRERWLGIEDLDDEGLPADMPHLLALYQTWQTGNY